MNKYTYVKQIVAQNLDKSLFNKYGLKEAIAMELAGQGVAHSTYHFFKQYQKYNSILILCGPGNNGGDGLVAARHISQFDTNIKINLIQTKQYKDDHKNNLISSLKYLQNVTIQKLDKVESIKNQNFDIILDALFGFSFQGPIRDDYKDLFQYLNNTQIPIISVDVPSGWNINEGNIYNTFEPQANISLSSLKNCMKNYNNDHYFVDHFVPRALLKDYNIINPVYNNNTDLFVKFNQN